MSDLTDLRNEVARLPFITTLGKPLIEREDVLDKLDALIEILERPAPEEKP